jgi:hypothetical protein
MKVAYGQVLGHALFGTVAANDKNKTGHSKLQFVERLSCNFAKD